MEEKWFQRGLGGKESTNGVILLDGVGE